MGDKVGKSKWSEESARSMIERNGGKCGHKKVYHPSPGLRVLGAIDYLVNYCHYNRAIEM